jgi:glycosyltransferase involved in cell wall biosynthesis
VGRTNPALRIVIVGGRILPFRHAGDKNYWLDVIQELIARGHHVSVMSVTLDKISVPVPYPCEFVRPIPVYRWGGKRFNVEYRWLRGTNNYASKTLSFGRIVRALRRHIRKDRPDVIHFASNFGPVMGLLKPFCEGVPLSISAPTYNGGHRLYDSALKASFHGFDSVVPFSESFARRLRDIGLPSHGVQTIRWGVNTEKFRPPALAEREAARQNLGIPPAAKVAFWAGFLQQMMPADFDFSVRVAQQVLQRAPDQWRFFFCFKPEHFDERYREYERPGLTVGSAELFGRVQSAADVMISPLADIRSTAAPPLTWIESMALGIPLLTTPIPGADEIVEDGVNGFLVRSSDEAAQRLIEFFGTPERAAEARRQARRRVEERFTITHSVTEYVNLWSELARRPVLGFVRESSRRKIGNGQSSPPPSSRSGQGSPPRPTQ